METTLDTTERNRTLEAMAYPHLHPCIVIACGRMYERHRQIQHRQGLPPVNPGCFLNEVLALGIRQACVRYGVKCHAITIAEDFPDATLYLTISELHDEHLRRRTVSWLRMTVNEYKKVLMLDGLQAMGEKMATVELALGLVELGSRQ